MGTQSKSAVLPQQWYVMDANVCQKGLINQSWADFTSPLALMCSLPHATDQLSILTIVHSDNCPFWGLTFYFSPLKFKQVLLAHCLVMRMVAHWWESHF